MKINFTSFLVTEALIYAALVTALADSCIRITRGTITISQALVVLMLSYSYFSSAQQLIDVYKRQVPCLRSNVAAFYFWIC